jgi:hypothetical protein
MHSNFAVLPLFCQQKLIITPCQNLMGFSAPPTLNTLYDRMLLLSLRRGDNCMFIEIHSFLKMIKTILKNHYQQIQTASLAILLIALWFYYSNMEILAQPDFYKFYFHAERLLNFDFRTMPAPPLFPLLLGLLSKFFTLFSSSDAIPLWAGRTLNLAATLGCLFFINHLSGRFDTIGRSFFLWALCLSHLFLCFHSTPVTEMIFLCFFLATFDSLSRRDTKRIYLYAILATVTRYEGFLLLIIACVYVLTLPRLRSFRTYFFIGLCLLLPTFFILMRSFFLLRLKKFTLSYFLAPNGAMYFIYNPGHLFNILYSNVFFFLPAPAPMYFQIITMSVMSLLILAGFIILFKKHAYLAWSALFFLVSFFLAKGYLSKSDPYYPDTRRVIYPIILILLICFWGLQALYKKYRAKKLLTWVMSFGILFSFFLIFHVPNLKSHFSIWTILAMIPLMFILFIQQEVRLFSFLKYLFAFVLIILLSLLFHISFIMGTNYLNSSPSKGAFAIAQYYNNKPEIEPILFCTEKETFDFYSQAHKRGLWLFSDAPLPQKINYLGNKTPQEIVIQKTYPKKFQKTTEGLIKYIKYLVKVKKFKQIAFCFYLSYPKSALTFCKKRLMKLSDQKDLFFAKPLLYKGQVVAYILTPRFKY